jgi:membrane-bound ClpP family serine protease
MYSAQYVLLHAVVLNQDKSAALAGTCIAIKVNYIQMQPC